MAGRWRRAPGTARGIWLDPVGAVIDHYAPVGSGTGPVVWMRTPYGRRGIAPIARRFARAGAHVVAEDVETAPLVDPLARDDRDVAAVETVVAWLRGQPWFTGVIVTWGLSAIGYASWRLAAHDIPEWRLAILQDAQSELRDTVIFPGGAFAGSVALGSFVHSAEWHAEHPDAGVLRGILASVRGARRAKKILGGPPLGTADQRLVGHRVDYFQHWLAHEQDESYWRRLDLRANAAGMPQWVHLASGWYDVCLPSVLADYQALRAAGKRVRLLIGPWYHGRGVADRDYRAEIERALHQAGGAPDDEITGVRVHVGGVDQWRDLAAWPPPGSSATRWHLHPGNRLAEQAPGEVVGALACYRYDPADPTPSVGGAVENFDGNAGAKDNRRLEARSDVVTFTSERLAEPLEVIGPVAARIVLRATGEDLDVFVRVCDLHPDGRSVNLCDGIRRLRPTQPTTGLDGLRTVEVDLVATAHVFTPGHRIRVQVSGGAHPRYARNHGTGEALAAAVDTRTVDVEIHAGSVHLPQS